MSVVEEQTVTLSAVDEARGDVQRLYDAEVKLSWQLPDLRQGLVEAEAAAGDSILQAALDGSGSAKAATSRVESLRAQIVATERAIEAARRQRLEVIPRLWAAETRPLREQAEALRAQADQHQKRTDELLQLLREHEGPPYQPVERFGVWHRLEDGSLVPDGEAGLYVTKTQRLREQADALERQAATIESQAVQLNGYISAGNRSELLAALESRGPLQLAPTLPDVLAWLDSAEAKERERRRRIQAASGTVHPRLHPSADLPISLHWVDGRVDTQRSRVGLTPDQEHHLSYISVEQEPW